MESTVPRWSEAEAWQLSDEPVLEIGMIDGPEPYQLDRVGGAARLDDGSVVVADGGSHELRFFGPDGRYLHSTGGAGGGPDEFAARPTVHGTSGDTVLAWAAPASYRFTSDGELVDRQAIAEGAPFGARVIGTHAGRDLWMAVESRGPRDADPQGGREHQDTVHYLRVNTGAARIDTVARRAGRSLVGLGERPTVYISPLFWTRTEAAVVAERLVVGNTGSFQVSILEASGAVRKIVRRAHEPTEVTPKDVEARRRNLPEAIFDELPHASHLPAFRRLLGDRADNLWVEHDRPDIDEASVWSVFSPEGHWLGELDMPPGLDPTDVGDDYVLGVYRDHFDVEYVRMYELIKPGADS